MLIEAKDPNPIPVKYVSFGSFKTSLVKYSFNCSFSFALPDTITLPSLHSSKIVKDHCRYEEAITYEYTDFYKITDIVGARPENYIMNLPLYIQANVNSNVLLTKGPLTNFEDNAYEISI